MTRPPDRGFTLIELLVVIAIVALLIGILLPTLGSARDTARGLRAATSARSLMQAHALYAADHDGAALPARLAAPTDVLDEGGNPLLGIIGERYTYRIAPYVDFGWTGVTHIDRQAEFIEQIAHLRNDRSSGFSVYAYAVSLYPSFGINPFVGGDEKDTDAGLTNIDRGEAITRVDAAMQPDRLLTFASSRWVPATHQTFLGLDLGPQDGHHLLLLPRLGSAYEPLGTTDDARTRFGYLHARYQDAVLVAHLDGHTDRVAPDALVDRRPWVDKAARNDAPDWQPGD